MSSLQKFHRRTMSLGPVTWPPTVIGAGDATYGYWLGGPGFNALIAAPTSTEVTRAWGTQGTVRGTTITTNGVANTTTLFAYGSAAHPAAYYAKSLTTGGYNTWYLPAKDELNTLYSNKSAVPFADTNAFSGNGHWSSTEATNIEAWGQYFSMGGQGGVVKGNTAKYVISTRRYTLPTATIGSGDSTVGYWLGTAGDGVSKLVVAPKSTEVQRAWGSSGTVRGTTSTTNGVANTTTLFGFGSAAHPAAYYAKSLTTGGYNTWYLPAKDELNTLYPNKSAVPFATDNSFVGSYYWSSTEYNGTTAWLQDMANGTQGDGGGANKNLGTFYVRAVRRV